MDDLTAEKSYLFRHAMLREGAYDLQLPTRRALLHKLATEIFEELLQGDTAAHAVELLTHVRGAATGGTGYLSWAKERELHYLEQAAYFCQRNYDWLRAHVLFCELLQMPECKGEQQVQALRHRAAIRFGTGRTPEALNDMTEAVRGAEALGNDALLAAALGNLASANIAIGKPEAAGNAYERAIELARRANQPEVLAAALGNLSLLRITQRQHEEARELMLQAIEVAEQASKPQDRSVFTLNLARIERDLGNEAEAEKLYAKALAMAEESGSRMFQAIILGNLAEMHVSQQRLSEAAAEFQQALQIQRENGLSRNEAITMVNYALLLRDSGRIDDALETGGLAIEMNTRVLNALHLGIAYTDRSMLRWLTGDQSGAESDLAAAREHLQNADEVEFCDTLALRMALTLQRSDEATEVYDRIRQTEGVTAKVKADAQAAVDASRSAAPMLFRGFQPSELAPGLRAALLEREGLVPDALQAAMRDG